MSSIFGGSQQQSQNQSTSSNQAYPMLSQALTPNVSAGTGATSQIGNMLGLNGSQAQNQGFQNWQGSTGYQFGLNQGTQAVTGNAAASGLLNSGATAKALDTYGQQYANTQYGNYTNQLQNLANTGNQSASIIGSTGQQSQSNGNSNGSTTPGVGGFIGGLLGK